MFSDHSKIKWEINSRKTSGKSPNIWKLNTVFLNSLGVKEEVIRELEKSKQTFRALGKHDKEYLPCQWEATLKH